MGIAKAEEGEIAPDGVSWSIHGRMVWIRFKFLRIVGLMVSVDRAGWRNTQITLLRRGWGDLDYKRGQGWSWCPLWQIKLKGAYT